MSQYDEDIYDVQLTIPNFGRSPDGHLMPPRLIDTTTLQSQSSSLSPSSSVGVDPLQENPPPQGIPPIDQEGTLMGISSQLPSISTHGSDFSFDEVMGTSPQIGLLSCPLYPNPSFDQLERLKNELEQVGTTVQENVSQLSLHQLYGMKSILKSSFSRFEAAIQTKIESDTHSSSSGRRGDRYICKLCPYGSRKLYGARGSFKRHVSDVHAPRYVFSCPYTPCPWFSYRRDKVHGHLRTTHRHPERLGRDEINHLERRVEPPNSCELCMNLVGNWDEYFNCISNHCRIHEDDSGETSASQSRRSSRDSGNGGNGNGGNFTGGGGIPGTGFQNLFPYGDGGNQMNGNSFYSNTGQQYYSHGSSFSNDVGLASLAENYSPDASNSSFEQAVPLEEQVPYSQAPGQPTNREQLRRETQALSGCQHLPQGKITTDLVDSDDDDYSSLQSTFSETPLRPRHRSDSTIFETKRFERMPTKDRQKPLDPHLDGASNRQCKNCHHILNDCALCRLQKPEADRCHVCFDRLGQQQERLGVPTPQNHIYLHDVASSRKLDCRIDPTERDKEPINLTQEGQPKSCPYPISEESEQLNADFDNALTSSLGQRSHLVEPLATRDQEKPNSCLKKTPPSVLSSNFFYISGSKSSDNTLDITRASLPATRISIYAKLFSRGRFIEPSQILYYVLSIHGYPPPMVELTQNSISDKRELHRFGMEDFKCSPAISLSTELCATIRQGRAKLFRSCMSDESKVCVNQPQAGSRAGAKEKALDVLPPILVDLSQQTKLLQDLHRPKPLVSRRRYNALRAKLHVIVEILALRESVKSSVPQPNKRDTTSCSNSIISEQSLLILPRLDLDLGLQEIHSSIYIVLETLNMLKQLTKENASTTLSKHLYDADDEMALMIILIPVLATLLRTPTLQMSSAAFAY